MTQEQTRRTKRRYAHELYPHAPEWEVRPLSVEVPYLYARAVGLSTFGTNWSKDPREGVLRVMEVTAANQLALLADAIHQGLTGDEAWAFSEAGGDGQAASELTFERATHYGVPVGLIRPYPCGPEQTWHEHFSTTGDATGIGVVTRIETPEDECDDCTEPIPADTEGSDR